MFGQFLSMILSFIKIGIIGFGGGTTLIPVVEKEFVENKKQISEEEYIKHIVVANITPGALPVKLGATIGYTLFGVWGSILGAFSIALPGTLGTILLLLLFSLLGEQAILYLNFASVGVTTFIVFLLLSYIVKVAKQGDQIRNWIIIFISFLLTGGKEIFVLLFHLTGSPFFQNQRLLFDIETEQMIIITFVLILFRQNLKNRFHFSIAVFFGFVYAFLNGKTAQYFGFNTYALAHLAIMCAFLLVLIIFQKKPSQTKTKLHFPKKGMVTILVFVLLSIAFVFGLSLIAGANVFSFFGKIILSTVSSFGGGQAYISASESIFVQNNWVTRSDFYGQLMPIANALPGPILTKLASGIAYLVGKGAFSTSIGLMYALVAFVVTTGTCCGIAIFLYVAYDSVKEHPFILDLQTYVLPVIGGLLLSTAVAMFSENLAIVSLQNMPILLSFLTFCGAVWLMFYLKKRFHLSDLWFLFCTAGISVVVIPLLS